MGGWGQGVIIKDDLTGKSAQVTSSGALKVSGDITVVMGDVEIGAVEIKDGTTDQRTIVFPTGSLKVSGDRLISLTGEVGNVLVGSTATLICSSRESAKSVIIAPLGTVYLGSDSSVSSSTGVPLYSGDVYTDSDSGIYVGDIYGITNAGFVNVRYWRRW